jgi:DNA polymerase/3'-5' exonuclease PolX
MRRDDLKELGEVLDEGQAGLIVVYAANMADQIAANLKAANRMVSRQTDMAADVLAQEIKDAEAAAAAPA